MYHLWFSFPKWSERVAWEQTSFSSSAICVEIKYYVHKLLEGPESHTLLASLGKGNLWSLASWQSCESCHLYHYTGKNYLCLDLLVNTAQYKTTKQPFLQSSTYHIKLCPSEPFQYSFRRIDRLIPRAVRDLCTETNSPITSVNIALTLLCDWATFYRISMVNSSKDRPVRLQIYFYNFCLHLFLSQSLLSYGFS